MMMEPQVEFEGIHIIWTMAFLLDLFNGTLILYASMSGCQRPGFAKPLWWVGWWFFVDAVTLVINQVLGPMNPFSYHQIGIITGIAIFTGFAAFVLRLIITNKNMRPEDWVEVEKIAEKANLREGLKRSGITISPDEFQAVINDKLKGDNK